MHDLRDHQQHTLRPDANETGADKTMQREVTEKHEEQTGPAAYSRGSGGSTPDLYSSEHVHRCWIRRVHPS